MYLASYLVKEGLVLALYYIVFSWPFQFSVGLRTFGYLRKIRSALEASRDLFCYQSHSVQIH